MSALTDPAVSTAEEINTEYRIELEPCDRQITVRWNGMVLAKSTRSIILLETRHPPVFYFPREDVRQDLLVPTALHTHCPYKGNASYWSVTSGETRLENAVWSYETPYEEALGIAGYMAFYPNLVSLYDPGDAAPAAVPDVQDAMAGNPLVPWLLRMAADSEDPAKLVRDLALQMRSAGIPVGRLWLFMRTLHPESVSTRYGWHLGEPEVDIMAAPHEILETDAYIRSPLYPIFQGAGGVRRRLDIENPILDFPILEELHEEGMTDYVAMPLMFSDGRISALTLACDRAGGFSTQSLGHLYEILPVFGRLVEVHAQRQNALNILNTYLGRQTGERVLQGLIKRGDGEPVHAVIWFCDLRDSTALADSMSQKDFLALLNQFLECMAGAVLDQGGEVLRFIGDAVLGIFPIGHPEQQQTGGCEQTRSACRAAVAAVIDARRRVAEVNAQRATAGETPLGWGVGLHLGDVTYGNIGTPSRLEFTVIGAAANEAARIESMCKTLGYPVLISDAFAEHCESRLESVGRQRLKGVNKKMELFTLPFTDHDTPAQTGQGVTGPD